MSAITTLNGVDPAELERTVSAARTDPARADRRPHLVAEWLGADRSRVRIADKALEVNGPGQLGPMQLVLAAFAACEIDVIAMHATLLGVEVEALEIELDAHFDVRSYLGLDGPPCGLDEARYVVRLRAPGITGEQLRRLEEALHRSSPVGATLARPVRLASTIELVT
ncbi:MAG TPA: OsmC family protein [Candidatus Limnocylindria bacterium]|nr:OsmC family protein [Candidatus Limnocylindria bacterium]